MSVITKILDLTCMQYADQDLYQNILNINYLNCVFLVIYYE